ncbi:hypothetical protein A1O1_07873 [Capronia coronata CBS 617.96]|uniref:Major facilitator superfamily (MFS) profile domain-containing protein n=1 Tax=Capronia coronata CBS 617.96 TaxID=1182541 RepID=W9XNK3_9EURO|nr:uncharacterized protein A1O1_07873 [Capronia coronata CBS 617.96]EXJ81808.1 hypothetical protein A1O1_07873 [Capronia coronata CBS 617.96]
MTRPSYQATATASFDEHSLLATVNVVRSVVAAAIQPGLAKVADEFGRLELIYLSIIFYVTGTIVQACSKNVATFCAGAVLYQIGYTSIFLMMTILVSDISSLRDRMFYSTIPNMSYIIVVWVSGYIVSGILDTSTWRWGLGMWAIIFPVCSVPIITNLTILSRRADAATHRRGIGGSSKDTSTSIKDRVVTLFWKLDVVGMFLLAAVLALILTPLTLAGGISSTWRTAHSIAPLVVGVICIPVWLLWESRTSSPMYPIEILKNRGVWSGVGVAVSVNMSNYLQADYLYTVLVVSFGQSVAVATRVTTVFTFVIGVCVIIVGLVVIKTCRLKPFILGGSVLYLVAFGLLIKYRGGAQSSQMIGMVAAQVLLGVSGAGTSYPAQTAMQAAAKHETLATMTALYATCFYIGGAIGQCISGALWTHVLPGDLVTKLGNSTAASRVYMDPFSFVAEYAMGTPERDAVVDAYRHIQLLLCITGLCLATLVCVFGLFVRNQKLSGSEY